MNAVLQKKQLGVLNKRAWERKEKYCPLFALKEQAEILQHFARYLFKKIK